MDLKKRAQKLETDIPAIFLALKNKDTPLPAKVFAGLTIAYALSPVDLIPDFIPFSHLIQQRITQRSRHVAPSFSSPGYNIRRMGKRQNQFL